MKNFTQKDIKTLFSGLCCSRCKNEFSKDDIKILERDCDILLCSLSCAKCGKDFGQIVFNFNRRSEKHTPLELVDGPAPISYDDVIAAHDYIVKNL
ncbi:MAG: hypothetical protein E7Z87_02550 [Cyanobacteria bacterium SIG26]|nr:hypothetical protein [Cyanobacteria bacterium SIG26]